MDLTTTKHQTPAKYKWKGNKKQNQAMEYWLDPVSETFGNAYQSWLKAGFSQSYSKNVTSLAPKYISEYIDRMELSPEHIKQQIQKLTLNANNSKSPDDTRLNALKLMTEVLGMTGNKQGTTVNIVQPILGGQSTKPIKVTSTTSTK